MNYLFNKEERSNFEYKKSRAYVSSNLIDMADKWYSDRGIYKLKFKSKAWKGVSRFVNRKINQALVDDIGEITSSMYSAKAGCTCGCSPGYILEGSENKTYDVTIEFGSNTLDELEDYLEMTADDVLYQELILHEEGKTEEELYA